MEVLAIIPARGGSKSIPRKNIMPFHGKPLIAWSVEAALRSDVVTRVITSTDDAKIAEVAKKYGSEVPFVRPSEFSQDLTTDYPVFKHALDWLSENESYVPDVVVHVRATSPLRPEGIIDKGGELLLSNDKADSVRCVCEPHNNPYKMWKIGGEGYLEVLFDSGVPEHYNQPRQLLPECVWQIGTIDIIRKETILDKKSMSGTNILPIIIDNKYAVDIDDEASVNYADFVVSKYGMFPK